MEFSIIDERIAGLAGRLFSTRYQQRRFEESTLQSRLEDTSAVAALVKEWARAGASVAAFEGSTLHGYIVGRFISFYGDEKAFYVPEWGLGTDTENPNRLIRQMYAWLTRSGQLEGSHVHTATLFSIDKVAQSALTSIGFGVHHMDAVKMLDAVETAPSSIETVRTARTSDLAGLLGLQRKLAEHISNPPVHLPLNPQPFDPNRLSDPKDIVCVAEMEGRVVGFISATIGDQETDCLRNSSVPHINGAFVEPEFRHEAIASDLLAAIVDRANAMLAPWISTDFETANVEGTGFWLGSGFRSVLTAVVRTIPT